MREAMREEVNQREKAIREEFKQREKTQRETLREKPIKSHQEFMHEEREKMWQREETCKDSRLVALERQQQSIFEMIQAMMQGMQHVSWNNASSKSDISIQSTIGFGNKAYKNAFVQKATLPRKVFHLEGVDYRTKTEPWNEGEIGFQLLDANVTKEVQVIAVQDERELLHEVIKLANLDEEPSILQIVRFTKL